MATSHEDGLIDDENYRLLRAALFDRFAGHSNVIRRDSESLVPAQPSYRSAPHFLLERAVLKTEEVRVKFP